MAKQNEEERSAVSKLLGTAGDYTGTILGGAQILSGLISANQNKEPEFNIADQLKNLSREVRQRAAYGLDPGQKTIAENNIKSIQRNEIDAIKELSGGSVDVALANIAKSTNRTHDALSTLAIKDAELQEKKEQSADQMMVKAIAADEREQDIAYKKYLDNENAVANLIGAGVSNIVGESKLRKTNEQLEAQNDNTSIMLSIAGANEKADVTVEKVDDVVKGKAAEKTNPTIDELIDSEKIPGL